MKKFFITIILIFSLISCTEVPTVVTTACDITQEICKYAQLICNNLPDSNLSEAQQKDAIDKLTFINANLKKSYEKSEMAKQLKITGNTSEYDEALVSARNDLKKLADQLTK